MCRRDWSFDSLQETRRCRRSSYVLSDDITHLRALKHTLSARSLVPHRNTSSRILDDVRTYSAATLGGPNFRRQRHMRRKEKRTKERSSRILDVRGYWCSCFSRFCPSFCSCCFDACHLPVNPKEYFARRRAWELPNWVKCKLEADLLGCSL